MQRRGRVESTLSATNISREIFPAGTSIIRLIFPVSHEPSSENLVKKYLYFLINRKIGFNLKLPELETVHSFCF